MKRGPKNKHPDLHKINDWFPYGPRNSEVEAVVRELTIGKGLRLEEVERLMIEALEQKLRVL